MQKYFSFPKFFSNYFLQHSWATFQEMVVASKVETFSSEK